MPWKWEHSFWLMTPSPPLTDKADSGHPCLSYRAHTAVHMHPSVCHPLVEALRRGGC